MYINKAKDAQPHCNAIVKDVFSKTYIANWRTWNSWRKYSPEVVKGSLALAEKCESQCTDGTTMHKQWCCMMAGDADLKAATMNVAAGKERWEKHCGSYQTPGQCEDVWAWEPSVNSAPKASLTAAWLANAALALVYSLM